MRGSDRECEDRIVAHLGAKAGREAVVIIMGRTKEAHRAECSMDRTQRAEEILRVTDGKIGATQATTEDGVSRKGQTDIARRDLTFMETAKEKRMAVVRMSRRVDARENHLSAFGCGAEVQDLRGHAIGEEGGH